MEPQAVKDIQAYYDFLAHRRETEVRIVDAKLWQAFKVYCSSKGIEANHQGSAFPKSKKEFVELCDEFNGKCNLYAGVNERQHLGTTDLQVVSLTTIFIDLDPKRAPNTAATPEQVEDSRKVAQRVKAYFKYQLHADNCLEAFSGNGTHLYYPMKPIKLTAENIETVKQAYHELGAFLQKHFSSDNVVVDNVFNLSRIAKIAGTISIKGGEQRQTRITDANERKNNESLNAYLNNAELLPIPRAPRPPSNSSSPDFERLVSKDAKLRDLYEGQWQKYGYKSRSEAEFALLTKLAYYGFSQGEAFSIMERAGIGKWREKGKNYRELSWRKASRTAH